MKSYALYRLIACLILTIFIHICLFAETNEHVDIEKILKTKYGNDIDVRVDAKNNVLRSISRKNLDLPITSSIDARKHADRILSEFEPYTRVEISQFDSIDVVLVDPKINMYVAWYYQLKLGGINFDSVPFIGISFYEGNRYTLTNAFVYDFKLPERPYISRERIEEIARTEHQDSIKYIEDLDTTTYKIKRRELVPSIELLICSFQDKDNNVSRKLAYRIKYFSGYRIYVDAKTGEIIKKYNFMRDFYVQTKGQYHQYAGHNSASTYVGLHKATVTKNNETSGYCTNWDGFCTLPDTTTISSLQSYLYNDESALIFKKNTSGSYVACVSDTFFSVPNGYEIEFLNTQFPYHSPSVYQYVMDCRNWFQTRLLFSRPLIGVLTNWSNISNPLSVGGCNGDTICIRGDAGQYSNVAKHEYCHSVIYNKLSNQFVQADRDTLKSATDEALAIYFACASEGTNGESTFYAPGLTENLSSIVHVNNRLAWLPNFQTTIKESDWSRYCVGFSLAGVWWSLRSITPLGFDITWSLWNITGSPEFRDNSDRQAPRTIFNRLMLEVNSNAPYPPDANQQIVINAYKSTGFYFYPRVFTCNRNGREQDNFKYNNNSSFNTDINKEKLFIKVVDCPPNTPIKIYIIKRPLPTQQNPTDYHNYSDGMAISSLQDYIVDSLMVTTNISGQWTNANGNINDGLVFNINNNGKAYFDIIVDVNWSNPDSDNSGKLRYKYSGIQDGIKGLLHDKPGFCIDAVNAFVVFALDQSGSMLDKAWGYNYGDIKLLVAERAAKNCLYMLGYGTHAGVVHFNNKAWAEEIESNYYRTLNYWPHDYDLVRDVIEISGNVEGGTNIRRAVEVSYEDIFLNLNNSHSVSTLLITDGMHNIPEGSDFSIPYPNYPPNAKIYALTIGYPSYDFREMLLRLVKNRNGELLISRNEDSMEDRILEFLTDYFKVNVVNRTSGSIAPENSDPLNVQFNSDLKTHNFTISLLYNATEESYDLMPLKIFDPNNNEYTIDNTNDDVSFLHVGNLTVVRILSPLIGSWTAQFYKDSQYVDSLNYLLTISTENDYEFEAEILPISPGIGSNVRYTVEINNKMADVFGGSVQVIITDPDSSVYNVQLFDDGAHGDGIANDGIYSALFGNNDKVGMYQNRICVTYPGETTQYFREYSFYNGEDGISIREMHPEWNWVGFPRIPRDSLGEVNAQDFIYPTLPMVSTVLSQNGCMEYDNYDCIDDTIIKINSIEGYKLKVNDAFEFIETGSQVDTTLAIEIYHDNWYWLCYPKKTRLEPEEVFYETFDCFDFIMAEEWSMYKEEGIWYEGDNSSKPMLEYGDAFVAHSIQDAVLHWSPINVSKPEVIRLDTQYFTFETKPEYETIMIDSIFGNPQFTEIGVFYDDECIGAAVMESYPIQILVYTPEADKDNEPYQFRLIADNKSYLSYYQVYGKNVNQANSYLLFPSPMDFRVVKLYNSDNVPIVLSLHQNYPNPFNPTTTITYTLPTDTNVKIQVYNVRGQLVKELTNSFKQKGIHKLVWDGKDNDRKTVGSGVYFYRLSTGNKSITKRCLLLK